MSAALKIPLAVLEAEIEARRLERIVAERRTRRELAKTDFRVFCSLLSIRDKSGALIPFRLKRVQSSFVDNATGRDIVLKNRRVGFTTLGIARDVWRFATVPGASVVIVVQSAKDNAPLRTVSAIVAEMIASLERSGWSFQWETRNASEWRITSGATIRILVAGGSVDAAAKVGRAGNITHLHLTEVAFWDQDETTWNAIQECVPARSLGSEILFESTPNGARGLFYEMWRGAPGAGYQQHFAPWFDDEDCATPLAEGETITPANAREVGFVSRGVRPEQLKWYRNKLAEKLGDQDKMDQEYASDEFTCWLSASGGFFDIAAVRRVLDGLREPVAERELGVIVETRPRERRGAAVRVFAPPVRGAAYQISADPSGGTGGDFAGGIVMNAETGEHVATIRGQISPPDFAEMLIRLGGYYNLAWLIVERNNHGGTVLQRLIDRNYPRIYGVHCQSPDGHPGWNTTGPRRTTMLDDFAGGIRGHEAFVDDAGRQHPAVEPWTTPDRLLASELQTFVKNDGKPQAAAGSHDDLVMAAGIGYWVLMRTKEHRKNYRSGMDPTNLPPA